MSPKGWLDMHCHFYLPFVNIDQRKAFIKGMHDLCFLAHEDWDWTVENSLAQQNAAGVQMQMLSFLPRSLATLRAANDYAAELVAKYPSRFGLLAALPTDDPIACLEEIDRAQGTLSADGFAVSAIRNGVSLSDPRLIPVWSKLDQLNAVVFSHPDASCEPRDGRPSPLIEVGFQTCRVVVDMIYQDLFRRFPRINWVFSHCAGGLPALAGRLELLGGEDWVPNPRALTGEDIRVSLASLYVDVAASAKSGMQPAIKMVGVDRVLYGADCGVPCSTHETMLSNRNAVVTIERELSLAEGTIGRNAWALFPKAVDRVETSAL